jgi:hypothetical protein
VENDKCAFSATLMGNDYGCRHARAVTRRGGPDVACTSPEAQVRCGRLFEAFKLASLPIFGYEDDLLSMPHSCLVKMQFGGLLGLQRVLAPEKGEVTSISDICGLVDEAESRFGVLDGIPYNELVNDITNYKLRRRR